MEFIETTLTLVMHNTTFKAELSKNTDPAADVNKELSKATNPAPDAFLKLLIAEFNRHSSSAAVTQNALAVKLKCYALLLFASNSGLDDGKLDMEILHEPVTLLRSFIARSMLSQKTETIYQSISRCLGCYCSKVITMSDNVITLPFSVESFSVHDNKGTMQDDCSSCNKRQEHEKSICVQKVTSLKEYKEIVCEKKLVLEKVSNAEKRVTSLKVECDVYLDLLSLSLPSEYKEIVCEKKLVLEKVSNAKKRVTSLKDALLNLTKKLETTKKNLKEEEMISLI